MAKREKLDRKEQTVLNYKKNGGNMKKAMIDAGYSESYANSHSKYLSGIIGQRIIDSQKTIRNENIKSIEEIQVFWSEVMDDETEEMQYRLKSSELLAKSQGGFIENVNLSGTINPLAGLTTEELKKLVDDG